MTDFTRVASGIAVKGVRDMQLHKFGPFYFVRTEMADCKDWQFIFALWHLKLVIAWSV